MNAYDDELAGRHSGWGAPHALSYAALAADVLAFGRECRLVGWSARETAGAVAAFTFYDSGTDGQGEIVGSIALIANASDTQWLGDSGVTCRNGLFIEVESGQANLTLWIRDPLVP